MNKNFIRKFIFYSVFNFYILWYCTYHDIVGSYLNIKVVKLQSIYVYFIRLGVF